MTIDTRKVTGRREIRFESLGELRADVERLREAAARGSVEALGNWTAGQATQHLARFMTCSIEGFDKAPFFLRPMGMVLQLFQGKKILNRPPPPGFRIPHTLSFFPDAEVEDAVGARELLAVIDRLSQDTKCVQPSPLLGRLSHEQWIKLHLRHAELHMSFFKV